MKNEDLKPCPFCGGEAVCDTVKPNDCNNYVVSCLSQEGCAGAIYIPDAYYSEQEAIKAWNTRPSLSVEEIEEVVKDKMSEFWIISQSTKEVCRDLALAIKDKIENKKIGGRMSRQFDAKQSALKAYPEDRESAVKLFRTIINMDIGDIEYELGMTCEEYIFGKDKIGGE